MSQEAPVTQKTIAEELGVSVTTVARALKGGERISADMIQKVKQTADKLGYVPNLDGVKLRTGKTFVVMTFLSFSTEEEIGDSGSVGLLNGIHARFAESDYAVRAVPVTSRETGLQKLRQVVKGRNADGVILDHTTPRDERVAYLLDMNVPFVTFGRTEFETEHAYFDLDNERAAYEGTKSLIDQGYKRIALLDADQRFSFVGQRVRGYRRALEEARLPFDTDLLSHMELDAKLARETAKDLVKNHAADAFVCVNELVFLGARAGVRQVLDAQDAEKIGYSLRSGTNLGAYLGSDVCTSHYSRFKAGWNLANILLDQFEGKAIKDCQVIGKTEERISNSGAL